MQLTIVIGLFRYETIPIISNKPKTLTKDKPGLYDRSSFRFINAAMIIITPTAIFFLPKKIMQKSIAPINAENMNIFRFRPLSI